MDLFWESGLPGSLPRERDSAVRDGTVADVAKRAAALGANSRNLGGMSSARTTFCYLCYMYIYLGFTRNCLERAGGKCAVNSAYVVVGVACLCLLDDC